MPDQQTANPQPVSVYVSWLRNLGISVFVIATIIALVLLWRQPAPIIQKFWMIVGWLVACGAMVLSYLTTVRNRGTAKQVIPATVIFDSVCFIVGGLIIVSFYSVSSPLNWAASMIWSFACLALGAITGFLFGIPRSRSRGQTVPRRHGAGVHTATGQAAATDNNGLQAAPADTGTHSESDESPIEQISDWLTKIIVGLGLANLKELPANLDTWAHYVAAGIPTGATAGAIASAASFALGLIIYFLVLGFLSCYVMTQMFLLDFINKVRAG